MLRYRSVVVATLMLVLCITPILSGCGSTAAPTAVPTTVSPTQAPAGSTSPTTAPVATKAAPTATAAPALPKVVRIGFTTYPDTLDPQKMSAPGEIAPAQLLYDGLTRVDAKGQLQPGAAEKWELAADAKSITFHLRAGLKRADGTAVTAADFVWAYKRLADPRTAAELGGIYDDAVGVADTRTMDPKATDADIQKALDGVGYKATDDRTFVVSLVRPSNYWAYVASMYSGYVPDRRAVEKDPEAWWAKMENHNGYGPYKFAKLEESKSFSLVANPNYYGGKPKVDRIEIYYNTDSAVLLAAYKKGELDIVPVFPEDYPAVMADATLSKEFVHAPAGQVWFMRFDNRKKPFDNVLVRKAFSMAFDRDTFNRDIMKNQTTTFLGWIVPGVDGYDKAAVQNGYDPKAAVATLIEAGYGAAGSTKESPKIDCAKLGNIKITYAASARNHARYQYIAGQFAATFGCAVTLDPVDATTLTAMSRDPVTAPAFMITYIFQDYAHPQNWLWIWQTNGWYSPRIGYSNLTYDETFLKATAEIDPAKALQLYKDAQKIFINDYPVAFMSYQELWYLVKPYVKGFTDNFGTSDMVYPGAYGPIWTYDVDTTKVGAGYPTK